MLSCFEVNAWQTAYHDALRETDPAKLHHRVEAAEEAMYKRLQELASGQVLGAAELARAMEAEALNKAARGQLVLKRDKLPPIPCESA
jgi:hypothetical protein